MSGRSHAPHGDAVCTRNEDLGAVLGACPEEKKQDLVFLQNGQLEPFRQQYGLYDVTQAMLWLAVVRLGGKPIDGITSVNPEGLTAATGKWADALKMRLGVADLTCNVMMERDYRRNALEKLVWISAFMLIGQVHGGITVGEVAKKHFSEVEEMVVELAGMIRSTIAVSFKPELPERLCSYAERVRSQPRPWHATPRARRPFPVLRFSHRSNSSPRPSRSSSVRAQHSTQQRQICSSDARAPLCAGRNGWFYRYTLLAGGNMRTLPDGRKIEVPDPTPMHTEYLQHLADKGQLDLSEVTADGIRW